MVRFCHLPCVLLIPLGLSGLASANTPPAIEPVMQMRIEVPRVDGIVGSPTPDLMPPPAIQAVPVVPPPAVAAPAEQAPAAQAAAPPLAPPAFALAAELAERIAKDKTAGIVKEDREAALKFYEARQGKPLWVTEGGSNRNAEILAFEVGKAADWGLAADAFKLPPTISANASRAELADAEATFTFAALKYARHARGGRVDPAALSKAIDRKAQLLPSAKVLESLSTAAAPDAALRGFHPQHPQFEKLRQKYLAVRAGEVVIEPPPAPAPVAAASDPGKAKKVVSAGPKPLTPQQIERKLLANMEMYRWMPEFGNYYIQPNIPEFMVRVVRDGKVIHAERIVAGKPETMTPTFSDAMSLVVFKPFWNVPESIKVKELQPQLLRSRSALEQAGLRAEINGRLLDTKAVDWNEVDMREVHIYQPPGDSNVLGKVKFRFPNKHDVYLHDTSSKKLFDNTTRAYSHGCVRVRDPLKLAEVLLSADKSMSRADVDKLANTGPENNELKLSRPVPIHLTYFTTWVDDTGKLQTAPDLYGHENRVHLGLEGKTHLIVHPKEEKYVPPSAEDRRRMADSRRQKQVNAAGDPVQNFFKSIFSF